MLPVTVLTGFLGGGKTTLLRRLLASPAGRRIGILMNERGVAGIDDVGPAVAGFIELAQGCVCCVDQPDLAAALNALADRGDLDRVILETTGLADPLPITWTIGAPEFSDRLCVDAVVAVVDAANWEHTQVDEWTAQVRSADVVVLTKLDVAPPATVERLRELVRQLNQRARLLDGEDGLLALADPDALRDARFETGAPNSLAEAGTGASSRPAARHSDFKAVVFTGTDRYEAGSFEDFIDVLPPQVFRAKGIVRVKDETRDSDGGEDRWLAFQAVGGRTHFDLEAKPPAHGESRLVFFGRGLDRGSLEERLASIRVPGEDPASRN